MKSRVCSMLPLAVWLALPWLVAAGCRGGSGAEGNGQANAGSDSLIAAEAKKPIAVDVAEARRGELIHSVVAEGVLRSRRRIEIRTELTGIVDSLAVDEGRRVRRGDLILRLDQREYKAALEEARARHLRALAELSVRLEAADEAAGGEQVRALRRRLEELERRFERGEIDEAALESERLAVELEALRKGLLRKEVLEAQTGFTEARAAEERALLNLERTEIRAPFDGVVSGIECVEGEKVYAGGTICTLIDTGQLEAVINVLESDLGSLAVGYPALLTIPAASVTLPVRVSVVSPDVDMESRTCRILLRFRNENPRIRPGMFVRAEIATEVLPGRLLVPREAVLEREGRPLVFKVSEGKAEWVYVGTGASNQTFIEITDVAPGQSLEAGDLVVVSDHLTLAHDAAIKVRRKVQPEDPWHEHFERIVLDRSGGPKGE